jgi:hypothetical protein
VAATIAVAVLTIVAAPLLVAQLGMFKAVMGIIGAVASAASTFLKAIGLNKAAGIFDIIAAGANFLTAIKSIAGTIALQKVRAVLKAVSAGANLASKILSQAGHTKLSQIFGLISTVTDFISSTIVDKDVPTTEKDTKCTVFKWKRPSLWAVFKFGRSVAAQVATIAGAKRVAGWLDVLGLVEDIYTLTQELDDVFNKTEKKTTRERWLEKAKRIDKMVKKINSAIGRVDKGIAMAR